MNVMLFEEWKDSKDYSMREWFSKKETELKKWFILPTMDGFEFDEFDINSDDLYEFYTAELDFNNEVYQFMFTFIVNSDDVIEKEVQKWKIECRAFSIESGSGEALAKTLKDITTDTWNSDAFLQIVSELTDIADAKIAEDENKQ